MIFGYFFYEFGDIRMEYLSGNIGESKLEILNSIGGSRCYRYIKEY